MQKKLLAEEQIENTTKYIQKEKNLHYRLISLSNPNIGSHFQFGFGVTKRERERGVDFG